MKSLLPRSRINSNSIVFTAGSWLKHLASQAPHNTIVFITVAYNLQNLEFLILAENILYTIINRTVAEVYLTDPG